MSDLHAAIMNVQGSVEDDWTATERGCYRIGHRDARHAAAELASEYAASHQRLKEALAEVMATVENEKNGRIWAADLLTCFYTREAFDNARAALKDAP